jgi:hypothetical protein
MVDVKWNIKFKDGLGDDVCGYDLVTDKVLKMK